MKQGAGIMSKAKSCSVMLIPNLNTLHFKHYSFRRYSRNTFRRYSLDVTGAPIMKQFTKKTIYQSLPSTNMKRDLYFEIFNLLTVHFI